MLPHSPNESSTRANTATKSEASTVTPFEYLATFSYLSCADSTSMRSFSKMKREAKEVTTVSASRAMNVKNIGERSKYLALGAQDEMTAIHPIAQAASARATTTQRYPIRMYLAVLAFFIESFIVFSP